MFSARDAGFAIIEAAQPYADLVETASNRTWSDPLRSSELVAGMIEAGWQPGWPYCAAFVEFVVRKAYAALGADPAVVTLIAQKFTPHVLTTFRNCGKYAESQKPTFGSIGFMRQGTTANGHAFIVTMPGRFSVSTIEGNTSRGIALSVDGDRNGDGIFKRERELTFKAKEKGGLSLLGFLNPMGEAEATALATQVLG